jgi:FdrA protein
MLTRTTVKRGEYYDSVTLLQVAQGLLHLPGIHDAAVVMGTQANKGILSNANLLTSEAEAAVADDLVIAVRAETEADADEALVCADMGLKASRTSPAGAAPRPRSLDAAVAQLPGANIALVSVAGQYAAQLSREALHRGLHVFLFSDNVDVADEIALKELGRERGLLVMGPDAGTAIVNGVALGFANQILHTPPTPGGVGIVAAAGTGLQAVTTDLTARGIGVTQAIGIGGRDLSAEVGGIMMIEALKALRDDAATQILMLVSKPPAPDVAARVFATLQDSPKPTIVCFLGGKRKPVREAGGIPATTLAEAAALAAALAQNADPDAAKTELKQETRALKAAAQGLRERLGKEQRFYRGLFSGGTFCYETQIILKKMLRGQPVNSNAPLDRSNRLVDASVSRGHTAIDLGEDEFTIGRLHPMLDPSLRNRRIIQEARDPETAVIHLDIVLGYGVHPDPAGAAVEAIQQAQALAAEQGRDVHFLAHVCGTDGDPQNASAQKQVLREAGVMVLPSNAAAARFAGYLLQEIDPD